MRAWRHLLCCTKRRGKDGWFITETQRHREKPEQKNRKSLDKKILGTSRPPTRHRQVRHRIVPRVEITLRRIHRAAKPDGGGPCVWHCSRMASGEGSYKYAFFSFIFLGLVFLCVSAPLW